MLELTSDPPAESRPVCLVTADDLWDHSFRALGFLAGYEQGVWASGVLRGPQADGWLQIEDTTETGYLIAPGFSGGPVWDDVLGGVVGMIVAADLEPGTRAAFLTPTDILARAWPEVVPEALLNADMNRLWARQTETLTWLGNLESDLAHLANDRVKRLLEAHRCVRKVTPEDQATAEPQLLAGILGICVLLPVPG
ncbi:MAG: hypothetical protein ACE5LU_08915 [Anaerolineae bacterium]